MPRSRSSAAQQTAVAELAGRARPAPPPTATSPMPASPLTSRAAGDPPGDPLQLLEGHRQVELTPDQRQDPHPGADSTGDPAGPIVGRRLPAGAPRGGPEDDPLVNIQGHCDERFAEVGERVRTELQRARRGRRFGRRDRRRRDRRRPEGGAADAERAAPGRRTRRGGHVVARRAGRHCARTSWPRAGSST